MILFRIKSVLIYLPITKKLKMKMKFYDNKVTDFYDKETPKMD